MFYITSKGKSMKEVWEFDNDKNADRKVTIYKEDIRWIKKKVPAKQERCTDCRRLQTRLQFYVIKTIVLQSLHYVKWRILMREILMKL